MPLNFLIATVPNPIETHLALWFDRAVESIINAAGPVGYRFQKSWVPWDTDLVREEPDVFKRIAQEAERKRKEGQPGALLFRNKSESADKSQKDSDLVVLLVPETPTGGIDSEIFSRAEKMACWASEFLAGVQVGTPDSGQRTIPVLGPSFSGSFASMAKIMAHDKILLRAISGTAASPRAWEQAFKDSPAQYNSTVHSLDSQIRVLSDELTGRSGNGSRLALLTETETELGDVKHIYDGYSFSPGKEALTFRYPREISQLRNAYGEQELKAVVGAQQQSPSFRNLLAFRLFDVGSGTDSTPVLARNQTPLSQDAVLKELARSLQRERVTLAGILATDVFDALFIARYLRDAAPDIRLFTFDSDLLYVRAAEDYPFDGTLSLATYPLMGSNQGWTNESNRKSFSSRGAEGISNAMKALLKGSGYVPLHFENEAALDEYFNPADCPTNMEKCLTPPVWLTVLGRNGYWPVAVMSIPGAEERNRLLSSTPGASSAFRLGPLPGVWEVFFVLISAAAGWHFVRQSLACATDFGQKRSFSRLSVWPNESGWLARLCYLLVCSLALLALFAVFVAPLISLKYLDRPWPGWVAGMLLCAFVFMAVYPVLVFVPKGSVPQRSGAGESVQAAPRRARLEEDEKWHVVILSGAALFAAVFVLSLWFLFVSPQDNERTFFFAYRSLHLTSGVSPLTPLVVLLPAYFLWAWVHLKRVVMIHERLVDVPSLGDTNQPKATGKADVAECIEKVDLLVNRPLPFRPRTAGAIAFVVALNLYLYRSHPLRSFEFAAFDRLLIFMVSVLYLLLFLTWTRFLMIWREFRILLRQLERHPIRFAFDELPKKRAISPFFQFTAWHAEFTMFVAIRERLAGLKRKSALSDSSSRSSEAIDDLTGKIASLLKDEAEGARISREAYAPLKLQLGKVNKVLVAELNRDFWNSGRSASGAGGEEQKKDAEKDGSAAKETQNEIITSPDSIREEVIALQYADYIQYILHQQRNLLFFVLTGFTLSIAALHAYPFQGPGTITTFVTIIFIAFALGVVTVLSQAERDPILSRITRTTPGELSGSFFLKITAYIGIPLITVLGSQFPALGRFLFSWIQPLLEAIK